MTHAFFRSFFHRRGNDDNEVPFTTGVPWYDGPKWISAFTTMRQSTFATPHLTLCSMCLLSVLYSIFNETTIFRNGDEQIMNDTGVLNPFTTAPKPVQHNGGRFHFGATFIRKSLIKIKIFGAIRDIRCLYIIEQHRCVSFPPLYIRCSSF